MTDALASVGRMFCRLGCTLAALWAGLTPSAAHADDGCAWPGITFPAQVQRAVPTVREAALALGLAVTTEGDAQRRLGFDAAIGAGVANVDARAVAVVRRAPGDTGGFWLVGPLAEMDPGCAHDTLRVDASDARVVVIGIYADDTADTCSRTSYRQRKVVIDRANGRILGRHEAVGTSGANVRDAVRLPGGGVRLSDGRVIVGGRVPAEAPLAALERCATPDGLTAYKAAMRWVDQAIAPVANTRPSEICARQDLGSGLRATRFADFGAYQRARKEDLSAENWEGLCAEGECFGAVAIWSPDPSIGNEVALRLSSGELAVQDSQLFPSWAGSGCPWSPKFTVARAGPWVRIAETAEACEMQDDGPTPVGPIYVGAILDARTGEAIVVAECKGSGARLTVDAAGQVTWRACDGEETQGTIEALRACK